MDETIIKEVMETLLSSLETLDTQSTALMEFVKAKGIAHEEELAPYLEQAGNASSVRWRAAKVRIDSLIASAVNSAKADTEQEAAKAVKQELSRRAEEEKREAEEKKKSKKARRRSDQESRDEEQRNAEGNESKSAAKPGEHPEEKKELKPTAKSERYPDDRRKLVADTGAAKAESSTKSNAVEARKPDSETVNKKPEKPDSDAAA